MRAYRAQRHARPAGRLQPNPTDGGFAAGAADYSLTSFQYALVIGMMARYGITTN